MELDARPVPEFDAPPSQHRVLRQVTESFGRHLERSLAEIGFKGLRVFFDYQDPATHKKLGAHLTAINYWIERVSNRNPDRQHCQPPSGQEYFREAPLVLVARYALTAWAPAPEDQELLLAAMRILHDAPDLTPTKEGEEDAIHWEDHPLIELSTRFSLDEARLVAEAQGMPLRPTVRYDITVRLDSERKTPIKRVKERIVDYKKLDG